MVLDFFKSQESLTAIQWVLRAIVAFFFLLFAAKIMGQRSISQLRLLDYIMALLLGNIIAHPLSDEELGLKGSMITMSVLVALYTLCVFLTLKWRLFRNWLDPAPYPLIKDGKIIYQGLVKAKISLDFLLAELRKEKIEDVQKVSVALWEADGTISFFLNANEQALTPAVMNLVTTPFSLPRTVIKEGQIDYHELHLTGKDENWLKNRINIAYNTNIQQILLATLDDKDNLQVFWYE